MSKTETIEASLIQTLEPVSDTTSVSSSEVNNKGSQKDNNKNYKNKTQSNANLNSRKPKKEKNPKDHFDHLGISNQCHLNIKQKFLVYCIKHMQEFIHDQYLFKKTTLWQDLDENKKNGIDITINDELKLKIKNNKDLIITKEIENKTLSKEIKEKKKTLKDLKILFYGKNGLNNKNDQIDLNQQNEKLNTSSKNSKETVNQTIQETINSFITINNVINKNKNKTVSETLNKGSKNSKKTVNDNSLEALNKSFKNSKETMNEIISVETINSGFLEDKINNLELEIQNDQDLLKTNRKGILELQKTNKSYYPLFKSIKYKGIDYPVKQMLKDLTPILKDEDFYITISYQQLLKPFTNKEIQELIKLKLIHEDAEKLQHYLVYDINLVKNYSSQDILHRIYIKDLPREPLRTVLNQLKQSFQNFYKNPKHFGFPKGLREQDKTHDLEVSLVYQYNPFCTNKVKLFNQSSPFIKESDFKLKTNKIDTAVKNWNSLDKDNHNYDKNNDFNQTKGNNKNNLEQKENQEKEQKQDLNEININVNNSSKNQILFNYKNNHNNGFNKNNKSSHYVNLDGLGQIKFKLTRKINAVPKMIRLTINKQGKAKISFTLPKENILDLSVVEDKTLHQRLTQAFLNFERALKIYDEEKLEFDKSLQSYLNTPYLNTLALSNNKDDIQDKKSIDPKIHQEYNLLMIDELTVEFKKKQSLKFNTALEDFAKLIQYKGYDYGVKTFLTDHDGKAYHHTLKTIKNLKKLRQRIKRLNRKLSKKVYGSKHYGKLQLRITKLYSVIKNIQLDLSHKVTTMMTNENDLVCIETLKILNMLKNHRIAGSLQGMALGQSINQLEYKHKLKSGIPFVKSKNNHINKDNQGNQDNKEQDHNKDHNNNNNKNKNHHKSNKNKPVATTVEKDLLNLVKINQWFASSKTCHQCSWKYKDLELSKRVWTCQICKTKHERDTTGAINIGFEGVREKLFQFILNKHDLSKVRQKDLNKEKLKVFLKEMKDYKKYKKYLTDLSKEFFNLKYFEVNHQLSLLNQENVDLNNINLSNISLNKEELNNQEDLNSKEYLGAKGLTLIQFNNNLVSNNLDQEKQELNQSKGLSPMGDGGIMGITQVLEEDLKLKVLNTNLKDPKQTKSSLILQCKLPLEGDVVSMEASRNDSEYCKD